MIESVFRSEDFPTEDRFDSWTEYKSRMLAPIAVSSSHTPDYRAYVRILHLGEITVTQGSFQPAVLRRTPKLIRLSDPEMYHLTLVLHGTARISHGHGDVTCRRYDIAVRSSSRPHTIWTDGGQDGFSKLGVNIPGALLPLPRKKADQIIGQPLSGRAGIGALLAGFLTRLARESGTCRASDGPRLGAVAADLVSSLFAHTLDIDRALPAETHRRVLTLRIRAFIEQHLRDPGLSPATIAAAHHISLSQLHRLFDLDGMSVMAWIRRQRLERARQDLADSALHAVPVHAIAARWGFSRHSVFTRAFRAAYGIPPATSGTRQRPGRGRGDVLAPSTRWSTGTDPSPTIAVSRAIASAVCLPRGRIVRVAAVSPLVCQVARIPHQAEQSGDRCHSTTGVPSLPPDRPTAGPLI